MHPEISEAERFPRLSVAGRKLLHAMREDRHAPHWNWPNGEQLDDAGLEIVQRFAQQLNTQPVFAPQGVPAWLPGFVDFCLEDVPFYRGRSPKGTPFESIPSCSRDDLAGNVWHFVPDSQPLDRLIVFSSSGTTGHPAKMPSHPATAACGVPLLEHILKNHGVRFPRGTDGNALTHVAAYPGAYTTAIVVSYLQEAGCTRINLRPEGWRSPDDCQEFLNRWPAPVVLGDPQSLVELNGVELKEPPQALLSCIVALSDSLQADLQRRYGCPVLDVYALTEAGIVAVRTPQGHAIVPHDIYVEILDEHDQPCPPGVRGEVTLSGGRNPFAPLLRYRTGDFAALQWHAGHPVLVDLEGRPPVAFRSADGQVIHSMQISRALRRYPLTQYRLKQAADGSCRFGYRGAAETDDLRRELLALLGSQTPLVIEPLPPPSGRRKVLSFVSECGV